VIGELANCFGRIVVVQGEGQRSASTRSRTSTSVTPAHTWRNAPPRRTEKSGARCALRRRPVVEASVVQRMRYKVSVDKFPNEPKWKRRELLQWVTLAFRTPF
jgi:hypothetical protein